MPVAKNRYYNDPVIGQAFSNLAEMFAPPSAQDQLALEKTSELRMRSDALRQLLDYGTRPDYQATEADRVATALGVYNPTQSWRALEMGDATQRYGYDRTYQASRENNTDDNVTQRYGYDRTYQASRENNTASNATALRTSAMDNQRSTITSLYGALNPGQVRPAVPEEIMEHVGLPGVTEVVGAPKPMSETEWQAAQNQRLLQSGQIDDQTLLDQIMGAKTPVEAVDPATNRPVFMSPGAAVREGAEPFVQAGSQAKPTNAVALMPDKQTRVPARQDPDGRWVHAQTGQELPADIQIFGLPQATGSAADVGLAPTTANATQGNNQEAEITRALSLLDIYEGAVRGNPGAIGFAGLIRGTAQNAAATANDLAASFGQTAPEIGAAAAELRNGLQGIAPDFFDPAIPEIEFLQGTLAYSLARTENPSGEVSRQAFERALDRVKGGGLLANTDSALAAIGANRKVLQTQQEGLKVLRAPGTGRTDTGFNPPISAPAPPEPPRPPSPPAPGTVRRYNPATGRIE